MCSRCGKAIYNIAVRGYVENLNAEYRYHCACLGLRTNEDDFNPPQDNDFDFFDPMEIPAPL